MSTPDLSASFYDTWTAMANRLGVDPLALARVSFAETGMFQRHPGNASIGVWPFIPPTLTRLGWTGSATDFTAQSPSDQIVPWMERYLQPYKAYLRNAGLVYVSMFLPARLPAAFAADVAGNSDSFVLTRRGDGSSFYEANAVLDRNHDGAITVGDLRQWLVTQDQGARWQTIESELRARGGGWSETSPSSVAASGPSPVSKAAILTLTAGALGLWYLYGTAGGARVRQDTERRLDTFLNSQRIFA